MPESLEENGTLFIVGGGTPLDTRETGSQRLYPCFFCRSATIRDRTQVLAGALSST
jgi:hypothetical protein